MAPVLVRAPYSFQHAEPVTSLVIVSRTETHATARSRERGCERTVTLPTEAFALYR
jgi:hypothetical protein